VIVQWISSNSSTRSTLKVGHAEDAAAGNHRGGPVRENVQGVPSLQPACAPARLYQPKGTKVKKHGAKACRGCFVVLDRRNQAVGINRLCVACRKAERVTWWLQHAEVLAQLAGSET
jgi:hypothetical protein